MFYLYFPYAAIVAGLIYFECYKKKHPLWWPVVAFFAPVTTPYFIFKSRKHEGLKLFVFFMSTFSIVCALEIFLYTNYMEKHKYSHLPPVARQIVYLSEQVKKSTIELDKSLVKLEHLSKVESREKEIKHTIEFIKKLRFVMAKNQNAIKQLITYTNNNRALFKGKELDWVFLIQQFYNNRNVINHYNSLETYLREFEDLLEYTYVNIYNIRDHKIEKNLKNYDEYYMRYRAAVDTHNRFNVKRIEYQNEFLIKHPEIKDYLPGERQTEAFKLWE